MPTGTENPALQLHYLYALRVVKSGWTLEQKTALADMLGRTSKWRGGAQFSNFLGQYFEQFAEIYTTDAEKQLLYARAPDFAPLSPAEIAAVQARGAGPGRGGGAAPPAPVAAPTATAVAAPAAASPPPAPAAAGGGGGRGRGGTPVQTRTQGRVLNKGEIFDEVIYTPRTQQPNVEMGRTLFEQACAACHRLGSLGTDHGVASLNLTASAAKTARRDLLESIMFPSRRVTPAHETTVVTLMDGSTVSGLVTGDDAKALRLLGSDGTSRDIAKPVRGTRRERATIMSDALTDGLSQAQLSGLLAFLQGTAP
jgi:putative heme-binding domain-containing protein